MKSQLPPCLLPLAAALLLPAFAYGEPAALPTDDQVRDLLRERIDVQKRGVGIVVGFVDERGTHIVSYGRTAKDGGGTEVNGRTMYEIGSVSKTFTTLLLSLALEKSEVKLDDPVEKYLPAGTHMPARNGREITLLDLATHRSALPQKNPDAKPPADPEDPYADITPERVYAFMAKAKLTYDIGSKYEYSNLGISLLGNALAQRAGEPYEQLLQERVLAPLGLKSTGISLSSEEQARFALPYKLDLSLASHWNLGFFNPAGGIRSDAEDMLAYVSPQLGLTKTPLLPAMLATQQVRNTTEIPKTDIGLAWHINHEHETPIVWHNGGTGGYRCWVGFQPTTRHGVVVLSNTEIGVDDLGFHSIDSRFPLTPAPKKHVAVTIKPELADRYVGKYQLAPQFLITFLREGDHYFLLAADQPRDEVFPESETDFFSKAFDGQISFTPDAAGKWNSLILHQAGYPDQTAPRVP